MISVTLKDQQKQFPKGISCMEIAESISPDLARMALAAKVDDNVVDLYTTLDRDCTVQILTFRDEEGKKVYRHTTSHILAQAVKRIYPTAKIAIGPAIQNGFYYDFDFKSPITKDALKNIEAEMKKIIKSSLKLERLVVSRKEAMAIMKDEPYKLELIADLPKDAEITLYRQGEFTDLCAGAHLPSTSYVKAFALTSVTGAYWRGDERNKMLTRIYGTAFQKKSELEEYVQAQEEAKKRDHNKLGRELGIFMTDENIGQGLPLLMPKGAKLFQILNRFVEDEEAKRGYILTKTPYMAKKQLYQISGHWDHYQDGMFIMNKDEDETMALRPMTCPFQYTIYNNGMKSYRDLPLRYGETSTLFRNEASGEMHGLIRVRQFTISEGHLVLMPSQLEKEFKGCLDLAMYMLKCLGFDNDVTYRFSKWDPQNTEKYINDPEKWQYAEAEMQKILDNIGLNYTIGIDEAAFYGPKLDIQMKNVFGKEDTIITIQVDMFLAERFDMSYVDEKGEKVRPYIIHRTSLGCYERTIALLIEKYAGAFPTWMAPEQVRVMSLTERTESEAISAKEQLVSCGIRAEYDVRNEKIGYKIREAQMEKIPYMVIIGDKEKEAGLVSVRSRKAGDLGTMTIDAFLQIIQKEIDEKSVN